MPPKKNPKTKALVTAGYRYYLPVYKPRHTILDHGRGAYVTDLDGNQYVDLGSGIGVNTLGYGHPELLRALKDQAGRLWHTSNIYFTEPVIKLARELVRATPFAQKVFFCNSGAEANEAAIKLVRKWASERGRTARQREIITFHGAFHGRTLATVTATAQGKYQKGFEPLPKGFVYCPQFNDEQALEKKISANTVAIMLEPIQGEGGVIPAKPGFLKWIRTLCDRHNLLMVLDEIQCGMGRSGKLWCHMWEKGVQPDIITSAKALGGGFPIGAMLVGGKAAQVMQFGSHGSTFGGNPMACAVARVVLKQVKSPIVMQNVHSRSKQLQHGLEKINARWGIFSEMRGRGLMIGAQLAGPWRGQAGIIMETAREHGVMILQAGPDVLRFLPPLTITETALKTGLRRFKAAIEKHLGRREAL